MDKKKKIIIAIVVGFIFLLLGIFFISKDDKQDSLVSRYGWIEMLGEKNGKNEGSTSPYFQDVEISNPYFPYVQAAVEWNIIDAGESFNGEELATGEFIALTAMKSIGKHKIWGYLGTEAFVEDATYIDLAIGKGLIKENELDDNFSEEKCEEFLEKFQNLYFGEFWRDDFCQVEYQDDVIELSENSILDYQEGENKLILSSTLLQEISEGDKFVFQNPDTGMNVYGYIREISENGELIFDRVSVDNIVQKLEVSDVETLTFDDLIFPDGDENNYLSYNNMNGSKYYVEDVGYFEDQKSSKGFSVSLFTEEDEYEMMMLCVKVEDNASRKSHTFETGFRVKGDVSVEVDIDEILVGACIKYNYIDKIRYAEVALDAHATIDGEINKCLIEAEKIPLCEAKVPLYGKILGAKIGIYMIVSADGSIGFEAEVPTQLAVAYTQSQGISCMKPEIDIEEPKLKIDCEGSMGVQIEPTLFLCDDTNIIDAQLDVRVDASGEAIMRPNNMICTEIEASYPLIDVSVCGDEEADTLVGNLGLSKTWNIIDQDEAFQFNVHHEMRVNGKSGVVSKCTYDESQEKSDIQKSTTNHDKVEGASKFTSEMLSEVELPKTFITGYSEYFDKSYPTFSFSYPDNYTYGEYGEWEMDHIDYGEKLVLMNPKGITLEYMQYKAQPTSMYGSESLFQTIVEYEIKKICDANLQSIQLPGDDELTSFMVAKIEYVREGENGTREGTEYVILPQGREGCGEANAITFYDVCTFNYPSYYLFSVSVGSDITLSEEEEKEIVAILSSFQLVDTTNTNENNLSEGDSVYEAMKQGDYSYFAGTYRPCDIFHDWYGGGEKVADLVLMNNGMLKDGGMYFQEQPYPQVAPIEVTKQEDGSYLCQLTDENVSPQESYTIYPEGVVGELLYGNDETFLRNTPYIFYLSEGDGGVFDIIYYKVE